MHLARPPSGRLAPIQLPVQVELTGALTRGTTVADRTSSGANGGDREWRTFSAKVAQWLGTLDETDVREIIRALVRWIEIDDARIEVIFRVPSFDGSPGPTAPTKRTLLGNIVQASVERSFG